MSKDGSETQTQEVQIPAELRQYVTGSHGVLNRAKNLSNSGDLSPTIGMSADTQAAQESLRRQAQSFNQNLIPSVNQTFNDLSGSNQLNDPRTQSMINAATSPIQQQLERYAIPATQDYAVAAGQLGSSRQGIAEGLARSDANKQMGDIASQIAFNTMQSDDANKQFALNYAPQLAALSTLPSQLLSAIGGTEEQYALNEASAESRNVSELARLLQGFISGNSVVNTSGGNEDQTMEVLGSLAAMAALFI